MKKRSVTRGPEPVEAPLGTVHPPAAGIDVGNETHYVAVPPEDVVEGEAVQSFGCFTAELERLARWLKDCGVRTITMQSTGVYWVPIFDPLARSRWCGKISLGTISFLPRLCLRHPTGGLILLVPLLPGRLHGLDAVGLRRREVLGFANVRAQVVERRFVIHRR